MISEDCGSLASCSTWMFTSEQREQIRAALVSAARADSDITGAAHLGSAAADRLDDWSDIDLALCLSPEDELEEVIAAWTARLYRDHEAVAHCDVKRGNTLYRVFLLRNILQVDVSFWPAGQFRAVGPEFIVLSSDLGQATNPLHPDGLLAMYQYLVSQGISVAEIDRMAKTNPAKLLGLNQ